MAKAAESVVEAELAPSPAALPTQVSISAGGRIRQREQFSKCGPWTSSISTTWKLVRKANDHAPPQTHRIRNSGGGATGCVSARPPDEADGEQLV